MSLGKDKAFGVTVLAGTGRVFQKTLSNCRIMSNNLRGAVRFAGTGKIRTVLGEVMVPDWPGNVLLNAFLQHLRCTPYVPTVAVAHKLI